MNQIILRQPIIHDEYTSVAQRMFDIPRENESVTVIRDNLDIPSGNWNIGLLHGPSGSGKSTLLRKFGSPKSFEWSKTKSIISHFDNLSPDDAASLLSGVGLSSVPTWLRTHDNLSVGEKFRCDMARAISQGGNEPIIIDEFTSTIDRNVARAASVALSKFIRRNNKRIVLASCHSDILPWLIPDWAYNPSEGVMRTASECLRRPDIELKIFRTKYQNWELFKHAHYLSAEINKSSRCFMATWNNIPVAFSSILAFPNPYLKNAWRESRTVCLEDYQGLGIGVSLSNYIGSMIRAGDGRFYSKTIHPSMVAARLKSDKWKETSHSREARDDQSQSMTDRNWVGSKRYCYAFEYIGPSSSQEESQLFWEKLDKKKRKVDISHSL